jgi:hypothetical protein
MFENENDRSTEQARSHALLIIGAIGALILTVLIVLVARTKPQSVAISETMVRAGSAAFDSYRDKIDLEVIEKVTHPNLIGMFQLEVRAMLHNRGDRPITGVEIQGRMLDMDDKVIAQNTSIPIPRVRREPLNPGESMRISVKVDAPAKINEGEVKDIVVELRGLRFEE